MDSSLWTAYIDGSACPNPGRIRIGAVAYAPDGQAHYLSQPLARSGCSNEAEALAAIYALRWLQSLQVQQLHLYTDSSILAEQMSQAAPKRIERLFALYEQGRSLVREFDKVQVQWIARHKNSIADALARGDMTAAVTL